MVKSMNKKHYFKEENIVELKDFSLIQEMADVQEYLDDIMYKELGKNMPSQGTNNEFLLIKIGELFSAMYGCEYAEFDEHHVNWLTFEKLIELWSVVLRTTRGRKMHDLKKWILDEHLTLGWINDYTQREVYEYATYIVMYYPRAKLKYLIKLTEKLGYSIKNVHDRFMLNGKIKELEIKNKKNLATWL